MDKEDKQGRDDEGTKKTKPWLMIGIIAGIVVVFFGMMVSMILIFKSSTPINVTIEEPIEKGSVKKSKNDKSGGEGAAHNSEDAVKANDESKKTEKGEQSANIPSGTGKPQFYKFKPTFIVTLLDTDKVRYLQLDIELMTRNTGTIDQIGELSPLIRNDLINLLSSQKFDEIVTPEGKERIRMEALRVVNGIMKQNTGKADVEQVLFTNFVTQ